MPRASSLLETATQAVLQRSLALVLVRNPLLHTMKVEVAVVMEVVEVLMVVAAIVEEGVLMEAAAMEAAMVEATDNFAACHYTHWLNKQRMTPVTHSTINSAHARTDHNTSNGQRTVIQQESLVN
jgi:hypothetical protein